MTKKRINILFLASWYPNKLKPRSGNFIQQHAIAVNQFCNVAVLHIIATHQNDKFNIESFNNNGIQEVIVYYRKIKGNSPIHNYQKLKRRHQAHVLGYHEVLNVIGKIDLTHLNVTYPAGLFALYLKQRHKIPYIITEHSTAYLPSSTHQFRKIETKWIKKIGKNASLICPVSKDLTQSMKAFGIKNNYKVIPNVVDTNIFKPIKNKTTTDKKKIIHISNLRDEQKNITGILNIIKKLSELRNDFVITIAGDGDIELFEQKANKLEIPKSRITFKGEQTPEQVATLMNSNDLFLLYSNYETFSVVIAEAWACGLPVITSKCGGLTEEGTPENGVYIEKNNEKTFLKELNLMLMHLSEYDPIKISNYASNTFNVKTIGNSYFSIYKKVLGIGD